MSEALLEGIGLTKAFHGVTVVDRVDIAVARGQVRAVIGENGAGKSTLLKILTGAIQSDSGEIRLNGKAIELTSPRRAAEAGIAIVHQELQLVALQSVTDNLMLVRPPSSRGIRRGSRAEEAFVTSMLDRVGLDVEPRLPVSRLSVAQCQMLEVAKALALDAQVIILDEPTAALLPAEVARLLELIERLRSQGSGLLYVSHALDEVLRLADEISVLRDGRLVAEIAGAAADRSSLIRAMVDRPVGLYTHEIPPARQSLVLSAQQLSTPTVRDITFELHAGEILGFAGLVGSGMHEAALALCGEEPIRSGTLTVGGRTRRFRSPHEASLAGINIVPEERKRDGIIPQLSVADNIHLGQYRCHARHGLVSPTGLRKAAIELSRRYCIRLSSIDQPIATLSGGNQQKALIARCTQSNPRVLIIVSPTRGVDIGAKEAVHNLILELVARGTAVILISPELEELLGLAHRIAVFSQGRMAALLSKEEAGPMRIMQCAIGQQTITENGTRAA